MPHKSFFSSLPPILKPSSTEEILLCMCGINVFYEFVLGGIELEESKTFIVIMAGLVGTIRLAVWIWHEFCGLTLGNKHSRALSVRYWMQNFKNASAKDKKLFSNGELLTISSNDKFRHLLSLRKVCITFYITQSIENRAYIECCQIDKCHLVPTEK